jgi:hypothetical protein
MKLQYRIKQTLGWCLSLSHKLFRVVPAITITAQMATLTSQAFLLLAFFLPLKVIILLGSEKTPAYFPGALRSIDKEVLIIGMSLGAALFYVFYLLSEALISYCCRRGANTLLRRNSKLQIFENQNKIAASAYTRFTRAMASALFFGISSAVLLFIYPMLLGIILGYIAVMLLFTIISFNLSRKIREQIELHYSPILNALSAIGFLLCFFCLVADYLYFPDRKIFHAVIAILIMRQALQRLSSMIQDVINLRINHRQINALFFHSQPLIEHRQNNEELELMLSPTARIGWARTLLDRAGISHTGNVLINWHEIDAVDVYAFEIEVQGPQLTERYLAKLFGQNISSLSEHERLLVTSQPDLPALAWVGYFKLNDIDCHLYKMKGHRKLTRREIGDGVVAINRQLLLAEPSENLLSRFNRTRPYLEQRLDTSLITPLSFVCGNSSDSSHVEQVVAQLPSIADRLSKLPRQIISLDITSDSLLISETGAFHLSHWGSWRVEAVGSNWPIGEIERLKEAVDEASAHRPALARCNPKDIVLAALMYALERMILRKNYPAALILLKDILACVDEHVGMKKPEKSDT